MEKGIFNDREKALEADYFRKHDARLLEQLRNESTLSEIGVALAEKLNVDNPELLARARALGVTPETAPAFFLAPLVQVAWAEGAVSRAEQETVLRLARERGIAEDSPAYAQLIKWLALFDTAVEVLNAGFAVLPRVEMDERIQRIVDACHKVAEASGSRLGRLIGLDDGVSHTEATMLDMINKKLRIPG